MVYNEIFLNLTDGNIRREKSTLHVESSLHQQSSINQEMFQQMYADQGKN